MHVSAPIPLNRFHCYCVLGSGGVGWESTLRVGIHMDSYWFTVSLFQLKLKWNFIKNIYSISAMVS